jgi:hypothetical protein
MMWYDYRWLIKYLIYRQERFSEISKDMAQVFFAVLAIEALTKTTINWHLVFTGIWLAFIFWTMSIISFKTK